MHIGAHKTGSTALQTALQDNGEMLLRHGVVTVPRSTTANMFVNDIRPEARTLIESIGVPTLIFTHEVILGWPFGPVGGLIPMYPYLYPETKRRLEFLAPILEGLNVQVIFYIRDQAPFLESFYIQTVQTGATFTFDEWIAQIDLSRLSWRPLIEDIQSHFPVCVKRFEDEFSHSQSTAFHRFLAVAAPSVPREEIDRIVFEEPVNRSLNATGLEMMIEVNKMDLQPEQRDALRRQLQKHLSNLTGERPSLLTDAQRATLAAYTAENEELVRATA
jgi:hypothetical protein